MDDLVGIAQRVLATKWLGKPLTLHAETDSTNDDVRVAAGAGAPRGYTVVADAQRAGRGRRGRTWHSPAGENVYVSMLLRPELDASRAPMIALVAGLAVVDALSHWIARERITIKWPNDVRIDGRKVAGILVEGSIRGERLAWVIVGIGINVRGETLPAEIASSATTVRLAAGTSPDRADVLTHLFESLEQRIDSFVSSGAGAVAEEIQRRCDTLGRRVRIEGIEGVAHAIDPTGALELRDDHGVTHVVRSGEVIERVTTREA